VDHALLRLPARRFLELDERQLPTGHRLEVAGTDFDFRLARPIGPVHLDTTYCELERDWDGLARATLRAPGGQPSTTLWLDRGFAYLLAFSGDTLAPARRRTGLALEPMTCPANAFRSGTDLRSLQPGESFVATWGLSPDL
jgi:aldose 1-epimerase